MPLFRLATILLSGLLATAPPMASAASDAEAEAAAFLDCWRADPLTDPWNTVDSCTPPARDTQWPDHPRIDAWRKVGEAHEALGLTEQARDDLLRAAALESDPRARTSIAWDLHLMGWNAVAEGLYDHALRQDGTMTHAWLARCVVKQQQEKWAASIPDCRRAYDTWQDSGDVLYFLTRGFIMVDDPTNALNFARYATQQHPDTARIWVLRVWAEEIAGNRDAARALAEAQLQVFPGNTGLENVLRRLRE